MRFGKIGATFTSILLFFISHSFARISVYSDQDCLTCHGKANLSQIQGDGTTRSLYVNPEEWIQDVHQKSRMTCVDCHVNANPYIHFREGFIDVDCESCHRVEAEEYQRNAHFEYSPLLPDRELPRCYHCHTRHSVLRLDNPQSSVHEKNIAGTCGTCHAEVMVQGLLKGTSLGKISGHRKGDISERFDMKVCIYCHNPSHSTTRVVKDFCIRCHDVRKKAGMAFGPTHLASTKWRGFNYIGGGLAIILILGTAVLAGYRSRMRILEIARAWLKTMERKEKKNIDKDNEKERKRASLGSSEHGESEQEPPSSESLPE